MLSSYRPRWLRSDIVAGLVLTALLVPQGMAYAELAGLPPITGLYTSILCLVGYAVFGPSKILVLGPDSSLGPMIAATLFPLVGAQGDPKRAVYLASALALLVGVMTTLVGIARLGFIADLISRPTILGYMNGLAVTILVGQLPKLFGFSVDGDTFSKTSGGSSAALSTARRWPPAFTVGVLGLVLILACNVGSEGAGRSRCRGRVDRRGCTVRLVRPWGLAGRRAAAGVPAVHHSDGVELSDVWLLLGGAAAIAVVSLTDTISTASSFAARTGEEVDGNA